MLASLLLLAVSVAASPLSHTKRTEFNDCLANSSPIYSYSPEYAQSVLSYNIRTQPAPETIIYPTTNLEISLAVSCAATYGASVSVRSGGHSYAAFGLAGDLVLSLEKFTEIEIEANGETVWVGAGNRLGDVAVALNARRRALPHGTCPWVGIGGHVSFGGFGYTSRAWGLTLDNVLAYDVVMPDGVVRKNLTPQEDPDLFWALNGAGASFGIISRFKFKTYPAPPNVINFHYTYDSGLLTPPTSSSILQLFQDFAVSTPANLGFAIIIGPGAKGISMDITGSLMGSWEEYEAMWPFLRSLPEGFRKTEVGSDWIGNLQALAGSQDLTTAGNSNRRDTFFAKSLMTPSGAPITSSASLAFFQYLQDTPTTTAWFVEMNLYGGTNSAVNKISLDSSSFGWRDSLLTMQLYASSPNYLAPYPEDGIGFIEGLQATLTSAMATAWTGPNAWGSYVNYVDPTLTPHEAQERYWGTQYPRLSRLKSYYDPKNVLGTGQAIMGS